MSDRIEIVLCGEPALLLTELSKLTGLNAYATLRKVISEGMYFQQELEKGTKVLLQRKDGEIREGVFKS
jgi:hypothetical protein